MIRMRSHVKRMLAVSVDNLLRLVIGMFPAGGGTPQRQRSAGPRVLVIRCDHIGDAAMSTAVLEPLRQALSASSIDVLAASWAAPIFQAHGSVDRVIVFDTPWWLAARGASRVARLRSWARLPALMRTLRKSRYDIGIDLRGDLRQIFFFLYLGGCSERASNDRTGGRDLLTHCTRYQPDLHQVEREMLIAKMFGATNSARLEAPTLPDLPPAVADMLSVARFSKGYVAFALIGNKPNRNWPVPEASRVVQWLWAEHGIGSVFLGGRAERGDGDNLALRTPEAVVNLAGATSLLESCSVLAKARAMVSVDTGPMHLAALVSIPTLALFGAGKPEQFGPWCDIRRILISPHRCTCPEERCLRVQEGPSMCMQALSWLTVRDALSTMLNLPDDGSVAVARSGSHFRSDG